MKVVDVFTRNNVSVRGRSHPQMLFSHGFGCDQSMWSDVASRFEDRARVVLFDHVGAGGSQADAYDPGRHDRLEGYAQDLVEVVEALDAGPVIFVGHSVSATIGVVAARLRPDLFQAMVLVCASPRYVDTDDYRGGFSAQDVDELLDLMDKNIADWSSVMAPHVAGSTAQTVQADWKASVCRIDPSIARPFARATFLSDYRHAYADVQTPILLIDSRDDALSPTGVGDWLERTVANGRRITLPTEGHAPHMTDPALTTEAIALVLDETWTRRDS